VNIYNPLVFLAIVTATLWILSPMATLSVMAIREQAIAGFTKKQVGFVYLAIALLLNMVVFFRFYVISPSRPTGIVLRLDLLLAYAADVTWPFSLAGAMMLPCFHNDKLQRYGVALALLGGASFVCLMLARFLQQYGIPLIFPGEGDTLQVIATGGMVYLVGLWLATLFGLIGRTRVLRTSSWIAGTLYIIALYIAYEFRDRLYMVIFDGGFSIPFVFLTMVILSQTNPLLQFLQYFKLFRGEEKGTG
jgi:hypothetical protein